MAPIEIHLAPDDDAERWDSIISTSPYGSLFHTWNWMKITEKHTNTKFYPLIGMKGNTPIGIFPLFLQKIGPVRMVFSPPPHAALPYLGPVPLRDPTLTQEKWEHIYVNFLSSVEHFINSDLKANYISISLCPPLQDPRPFSWSGYTITPNYDYVIDLSKGIKKLYESLNNRQRADLKKAYEKGMRVEIGSKDDFNIIISLMDIRYAQQAKFLTASRDYFSDVFDRFEDDLKIFLVFVDDEVVTGSIRFQYKNSLYGWFGNAKPKNHISPSPNHLLFWETIRYASENGLKYYTTLGAAGNKRLHGYYASRFNPELRIRYIAEKKSLITGTLEKGYVNILKPMRGMIKHIEKSK